MIEVSNIVVKHGAVTALWDVSFSVNQGERVGLLGANGAGKSTTLGAIIGLYPVVSGSIRFCGQPLSGRSLARNVVDGIGLVPEGRRLFPAMTVQENLMIGAYARPLRATAKQQLDRVYNLFPILKQKRSQPAGQLSGGQQQMVAIGRTLMAKPSLLLLDEPFLGVAPVVIGTVLDALRTIADEGTTVILVEQNIHRAFEFVDRAYVIENGHPVMDGTRDRILNDPEFSAKFLGVE
jgi:branched-chain amino acid transport system ATP-binding protein